ncbi:MAG: site-specific integrase [Desulfovibrio sp.]|jgi:integrase|nr:site-specific integrase [Desulfovibrio sp.]
MSMKREKTQYPGVYYIIQKKLGSAALERVYYIFYRQGGRDSKQIEERVGRESEGMTAAKANAIRADRARGKELNNKSKREAAEAAKREEEGRPTIERLWRLYDETNAARKMRKTDIGFYTNHLAKPFGEKAPDELVTLDIDRIRIKKLKTLAPATVKHILSLLRRIINFGVRKGLCPQPDASRLHFTFPKLDNQKTENLTHEQMSAYLAALDAEPDQNAVGFIRLVLATGIRKGAAMALRWDDVDFERGFITLRGAFAKNKKTDRIPLSKAARAILEKVERLDSPFIFPGRNGGQRADFKRISQRVRDRAGLPKDFRPLHGLRHVFASWMASTGAVDLYTLQKLLTHGSAQMTQRYAHLADEALQRAAAVAGEVFQRVTGEKAEVIPFRKKRQA